MEQVKAKLLKEKQAFTDAQQIMNDFNKFLCNGGLDVVGANAYDRQLCYDKYEFLEVMLKARQDEFYHRDDSSWYEKNGGGGGGGGGVAVGRLLEDVDLNIAVLDDIVLNAVYYMVPNNETRRVKNSGRICLLYARDPAVLYDARYYNQNIPQWLSSLPQYLFEPYGGDHTITPPSNMNGIPSNPTIYTPQSKKQITLSKPIHEQDRQQPSQSTEERNAQVPRKPDDRLNEYQYLSHRNRSAYYHSMANGPKKLQSVKWFSFCGCGRRASGYLA